jgi:hypothetical protein
MNSELFSQINWLAVLVAAVAYFILGALWYSKILFANMWIKAHGIDMNDPNGRKGLGMMMFLSFIGFFIICIGLDMLVVKLDLGGYMSGIKLGLATGVCFSMMALSITYLYTRKPISLHLIDGLYHVVGQIIAAIILCVWG